jgi:hypothetical protein
MAGIRQLAFVSVLGLFALVGSSASAASLSASYYTVSPSDPDFGTQCCGTYYNMVQSTLGPDGLPVWNSSYGGPALSDVNGAGEITWWSPALDSNVTFTGTGSISLPFSSTSMYPPNATGSNDANGFLAAEFTGILVVPTTESVTFTLGSDDDSFLYLNNVLQTGIGGVHADEPAPTTTSILAPGSYSLTLFYDDRYRTQAALDFSVEGRGVEVNPTPEPGSLLLVGTALAFLGTRFCMQLRKR